MNPRTQFLIIVGLIILLPGVAWLSYTTRNQQREQVLSTVINRDCAPWDGGAFTVLIPVDSTTTITISIWQTPNIQHPITFSLPDETGQVGIAYILPALDPLQQLGGEVSFRRVEEGIPVEGEFSLMTANGEQFTGRFKAEWGDQVVYCG